MKIYLLRHAEVIEEYQGKYNGHIDIPLSQNGEKQAKKLAKELKHIKFDKIYCSDLLRAKETLKAFNYTNKVIYSKKLREKSWGKHEGKSFEEITSQGLTYINFEQWLNALDGEDILSYKKKVSEYFLKTVFNNSQNSNILIITHAGLIKTLISIIKNISFEESFKISLPCASYIIFDNNKMTFFKDSCDIIL